MAVEDMGPSGLLCETDEAEDEREELFIGVNLFNGEADAHKTQLSDGCYRF